MRGTEKKQISMLSLRTPEERVPKDHPLRAVKVLAEEALVLKSEMMGLFRRTMFKRVIPNLKRIGLLSDRVRPKYAALGLLEFEHGRAAPELTAADLVEDRD